MPKNTETTKKMIAYAKTHRLQIPSVSTRVQFWGTGKATLAWRVSQHMKSHGKKVPRSARKTAQLVAALFPNLLPELHILHPNYKWNGAPTRRYGPPKGIVWHHAAGSGSPEQIHQVHLNIGDKGIAYTDYIRRNGKVYAGRPENTWGAHCLGLISISATVALPIQTTSAATARSTLAAQRTPGALIASGTTIGWGSA